MEKKICTNCREPKLLNDFHADNRRKDGKSIYCKSCRKVLNKKYKENTEQPGYKRSKRPREATVNPFNPRSIQADVFNHFYRFGLILSKEKVEGIIRRLSAAELYWTELDTIETELGCRVEDYDINMAELLRVERAHYNKSREKFKGKHKQGVNMLNLKGDFIQSFDSMADASQYISKDRVKLVGSISNCAAGLCLTAAGFIWEFAEN